MRFLLPPPGRVVLGAAVALLPALVGCSPVAPPTPTTSLVAPSSPVVAATPLPTATTSAPGSPTELEIGRIQSHFPDALALTSTGERLLWASRSTIWAYTPGDAQPTRLYDGEAHGALIWDIAAVGDAVLFSEQRPKPAGSWRVALVAGDGAEPVQVDEGVAERGIPPTLAIDGTRVAWAGFDEGSGEPRSFLRVAERSALEARTELLDVSIDDGLVWYPQLDGGTLWCSIIEPDFDGTRGGDRFHLSTFDLSAPAAGPTTFQDLENVFEPAVTPAYVAWKAVEPGLAALTWGELHVLDRRTNEELVIPGMLNHPTVGSRFVAFEEASRQRFLIYDLATRSMLEIPGARPDGRGTITTAAIAGDLLVFSTSRRGRQSVSWVRLPE